MGTNCLYVFKYNNRYYVWFKGNDSYPNKFGKTLIDEIKNMDDNELIELKNKLGKININDFYKESYCGFKSLIHSIDNHYSYAFEIMNTEPELYIGISYIYIINLDKNVFIVKWYGILEKEKILFDLDNIPKEWYNIIIEFNTLE